jgi:hypothetical protein
MSLVTLTPTADDLAHFARSEQSGRFPIDAAIKERIVVERAVIRRAATDILAAGCAITVFDGEDVSVMKTRDLGEVMDGICACDEEWLRVYEPTGDEAKPWKHLGNIFLVFGNEGWDVLADYHMTLEPLLAGANEFADTLSE